MGNVADGELTKGGWVGAARGDCCGLKERGEPRLRRVKDAWAEGSAGLRVTSKQ